MRNSKLIRQEAWDIMGQMMDRNILAFANIRIFREFTRGALPGIADAKRESYIRYEKVLSEIFYKDEEHKIVASASKKFDRDMGNVRISIDASSLIFAYSQLDGTVFDCLALSRKLDRDGWKKLVEQKEITFKLGVLSTIKARALIECAIDRKLNEVERWSLMKKIDLLFALCPIKPTKNCETIPMSDYKYDKGKITEIDTLRNDIIHKNALSKPLPDAEGKIELCRNTIRYLLTMLRINYNIYRLRDARQGKSLIQKIEAAKPSQD